MRTFTRPRQCSDTRLANDLPKRPCVHCTVVDEGRLCRRPTHGGKPWCSVHVTSHSPYALQILKLARQREAEADGAAIDPNGVLSKETLWELKNNGCASVERLSRDLDVSHATMRRVVRALRRAGLVTTRRNSRKRVMVEAA